MTDPARLEPCEIAAPISDQTAPLAKRPRRESALQTPVMAFEAPFHDLSSAGIEGSMFIPEVYWNTDYWSWPKLSTTSHGDHADTNFEVIHPHHPLRGQKFKLITYRHNWGEDRVYFHDAGGRLRSIPAGWTTAVDADPFVTVAAGRGLFRYEDLLKLTDLVEKAR